MLPNISSLFIAMSLATTIVADRLIVNQYCTIFFVCREPGTFITDFGSYPVDASDGCRSTDVPGMVEFCVDYNQAPGRGHFRFSHQDFKRCMVITSEDYSDCGEFATCNTFVFDEVPCTWRIAGEDIPEVKTVSATALPKLSPSAFRA